MNLLFATNDDLVDKLEDVIHGLFPKAKYSLYEWTLGITDSEDYSHAPRATRESWIRYALMHELPDHANVIRVLMFGGNHNTITDDIVLSPETAASLARTGHLQHLIRQKWFSTSAMSIAALTAAVREWKLADGSLDAMIDNFLDHRFYERLVEDYEIHESILMTRWPESERLELAHELADLMTAGAFSDMIHSMARQYTGLGVEFCRELVRLWGVKHKITNPRDVYYRAGLSIKARNSYRGRCKFSPNLIAIVDVSGHTPWKFGPMRAHHIVALVVSVADGYLSPHVERSGDEPFFRTKARAARFFKLAAVLPLELQWVIVWRVLGVAKTSMPTVPIEAARWALGLWTWPAKN